MIFIHKYSHSIGTTIIGNDGALRKNLHIKVGRVFEDFTFGYPPVLPTKLPQLGIGYVYYYINFNSLEITAYNKNISNGPKVE